MEEAENLRAQIEMAESSFDEDSIGDFQNDHNDKIFDSELPFSLYKQNSTDFRTQEEKKSQLFTP